MSSVFKSLSLSPQNGSQKPKRQRVAGLDEKHKAIIEGCLVYRVGLSVRSNREFDSKLDTLKRCRDVPDMTHHGTVTYTPRTSWDADFARLQNHLSEEALLPFQVAFHLQRLAQSAFLPPNTVVRLLPDIIQLVASSPLEVCVRVIRKLFHLIEFPAPHLEASEFTVKTFKARLKEYREVANREYLFQELDIPGVDSGNMILIHRASITPTSIKLGGPEAETNNRVLRKYKGFHDYFLRVQFCDEDSSDIHYSPNEGNENIYHERFKNILRNGIRIAGRYFEFLGFSSSSLRMHSCWFVAPFLLDGRILNSRGIIHDLGNFTVIRAPAKCAARIGQVFSDTPDSITLAPDVQQEMPDVEHHGRVFSDGVGTMSEEVMHAIWSKLRRKTKIKPTCFQIRFSGRLPTNFFIQDLLTVTRC